MKSAYDRIAFIYDHDMALNMPFPDVAFYLEQARGKTAVLEVGCGTGRITLPLSAGCPRLIAVDRSLPMLLQCRRKLAGRKPPGAPVFPAVMDARALCLKPIFDYIFFAFSGICYLSGPGEAEAFVRSVRHLLVPGGRILLDAFVPRSLDFSVRTWKQDYIRDLPDGNRLRRSSRIMPRGPVNRIFRRYEIFRPAGELKDTFETRSTIRPQAPESLRRLLTGAGFRVCREWWDYGAKTGQPADFFSVEAQVSPC